MTADIVAYSERDSADPLTGRPGILRKEWQVVLLRDARRDYDLEAAWGPDWMNYRPGAGYVLLQRYIRRGVVGPWAPLEAANSWKQALEYIDNHAVACCDTLQEIQRARVEAAAAEAARKREAAEAKAAADEADRKLKASRAAFDRLWESPRDGQWARRWNAFIAERCADERYKSIVMQDAVYMTAYQAVMNATTLPSKRKAIREFFKKHAPEWMP